MYFCQEMAWSVTYKCLKEKIGFNMIVPLLFEGHLIKVLWDFLCH